MQLQKKNQTPTGLELVVALMESTPMPIYGGELQEIMNEKACGDNDMGDVAD